MPISPYSIGAFLVIFLGHSAFSTILQYYFYYFRRCNNTDWKIQKIKLQNLEKSAMYWWLPILSLKPKRAPYHNVIATMNLLIASSFALVVTECKICNNYKRGDFFLGFNLNPVHSIFEAESSQTLPDLFIQLL
eukprot:gene12951-27324_t